MTAKLSGPRGAGCAGVAEGRVIQAVNRPAVAAGQQMAINRQGEGRGMVAELLLDVGEGLAGLDQHAGERVAERVRLAVADPDAAEDALPDVVAEGVVTDGLAGR